MRFLKNIELVVPAALLAKYAHRITTGAEPNGFDYFAVYFFGFCAVAMILIGIWATIKGEDI